MTTTTPEEVRNALFVVREKCGAAALDTVFKRFGAKDFGAMKPSDYPAVIAAAKKTVEAAVKKFEMTDHADTDAPAENIDPFQQQGAANNADSERYWADRKAAQAKGEPAPSLPADRHNQRVAEKLAADQDAARDLGANHDWKK